MSASKQISFDGVHRVLKGLLDDCLHAKRILSLAGATLGAEVDFVDIDPATCNLDPAQLEAKITSNTKAILPVHLYGQCCDMDAILALARRHGVAVVAETLL